ncbi:MAG: NAD-dependent epimerase/dehydratase family protein [Nanoarchaeota archaeon]
MLQENQRIYIYIASDKSFGQKDNCELDSAYNPTGPYETSKACEDMLVECYAKTYELPIYLLRFPNFIGKDDPHSERLIPGILHALKTNSVFSVRTNLDYKRQYIHVEDAARAIKQFLKLLETGEKPQFKNHFGTPHIKSTDQIIQSLEKLSGKKLDIQVQGKTGEIKSLSLSNDNALGYKYMEWEDTIRKCLT